MKTLANNSVISHMDGFTVYTLGNDDAELTVVPELGAKIISLKNRRTGREWLWHPAGGLKLFKNNLHDDFSTSPLAGVDECLPTILPCNWRGRNLPDHGEIWSTAWNVNAVAWEDGILKTTARLKISPFELTRTIELVGNEIRLGYELNNLAKTEENFIWAIHPLLRLQAGDQLELPASTRALLNDAEWVDAVTSIIPDKNYAKIFARPISESHAAIHNKTGDDRLEFVWDAAENNTLGLWLTRGGWHGHDHFAIEPTNAEGDCLAMAAAEKRCGTVAGNGSVSWQLCLRVGF